jgi:hypothetical protein
MLLLLLEQLLACGPLFCALSLLWLCGAVVLAALFCTNRYHASEAFVERAVRMGKALAVELEEVSSGNV